MSDFESCNGNCQGCSSTDCGDGTATITLTLDNDETVECSILTVFEAAGRDYIALLPWMKTARTRTEKYFCTVLKKKTVCRY